MDEQQPERTCEGQAGLIDDADAAIDAAVAGAVAPDEDPWATFDRWSANLFAALAILAGIVFLLVAGAASRADMPTLLLAILSIALTIAPLVVAYTGLRERASWARAAADVLLWAIILSGAIEVLSDLTVQKLTIPVGAILAVVVLGRRPEKQRPVVGRDRRIALVVGGAYLLTGVLGGAATLGAKPPAFLIADREDLVLGVSTNCMDPARITPGEDRVVVQAMWRWTRDDLLPGGQDAVQLEWHGAIPLTPVLADIEAPAGLDPDATGPAMTLLAASTGPSTAVLAFGVDSGQPGAREGTLRVPFAWTPGEERQFADFVVTWAHDDHWTNLASTSCNWLVDAEASPEPTTAP
jgi:hypothetical protein